MFCLRAHVEKYSGSSPEVSGVLFACSGGKVQWYQS